ncbi:hypothetical protein D3C85_955600 [compost metagenome]
MRDRERHARQNVVDGQPALKGLGATGIFPAVVEDGLGQCHGAVGRVDIDAVSGKALGQLNRSGGEHALVLVDVLAIDHQQWLFTGVRVRAHAVARLEACRGGGQAAAVGWNRAVAVTGLFRAQQGQAGTQFGRLLFRYGSLCLSDKHHGQGSGQQRFHEFHFVILLLT